MFAGHLFRIAYQGRADALLLEIFPHRNLAHSDGILVDWGQHEATNEFIYVPGSQMNLFVFQLQFCQRKVKPKGSAEYAVSERNA
jgi:hypothetical protein